jgi:hypothetical protein
LESQDVSSVIKDAQKAIFEAFREGKASKSDALPDGNTILHVSVNLRRFSQIPIQVLR